MGILDCPILSIIVPTKNRPQYIGYCISSLLKIQATDIEVIVQDNSDNNQTEQILIPFANDSRFLYHHSSGQLSMSDNFTKGLEAAKGEYVSFIGDDDGVNPEVVDAIRWAKTKGLDAIVGSTAALYLWPDVIFTLYRKLLSATLLIKPFTGSIVYPDPEIEMIQCVRFAGYKFGKLPKAYHGAVKREYLDLIFQSSGTYFPGPTPDMATAIALACVLRRYAYIDYPLFISGTGRNSGGGAGTEKKHDWSLESVPWFSRRAIDLWSDIVPRYCSGTTLWGEDVIQALKAMNRNEVLSQFNAIFLYARCAVFNYNYNSIIFLSIKQYVREKQLSILLSFSSFLFYYILTWLARLSSLISNIFILVGLSRIHRIPNIINIEQAISNLETFGCAQKPKYKERNT